MKETGHIISKISIEEYYFQHENGVVFHKWRFENGDWNVEETAFRELPYIKIDFNQELK